MKLIHRKSYLNRITSLLGRNLIVCLTGQRRVGKSSIMRTLVDTLKEKIRHSRSVYR